MRQSPFSTLFDNHGACTQAGDPVNVKEGVLFESKIDYSTGSSNPLTFRRYYWSDQNSAGSYSSRLGNGWRSNFDAGLFVRPGSNAVFTGEDGEQSYFVNIGSNTWQLQGYNESSGLYQAVPGTPSISLVNNTSTNTWLYSDADDTKYLFNSSFQLQSITYRGGYVQTLVWSNGLNTSVSDNLGRFLTFGYNANGLMTTLTTSDSQVFTYGYVNAVPIPTTSPAYGTQFASAPALDYTLQSVIYPGSGNPTISYRRRSTPLRTSKRIDLMTFRLAVSP